MAPRTPAYTESWMLRQSYSDLWEEFVKLTDGAARSTSPADIEVTPIDSLRVRMRAGYSEGPLKVLGVRFRAQGAASKACNIYIQVEQTIQSDGEDHQGIPPGWICTKSVARIMYTRPDAEIQKKSEDRSYSGHPTIYGGFHLDVDAAPQPSHPWSHVQLDPHCIVSSTFPTFRRTKMCLDKTSVPRIPTLPVDFPVILFLILKDHFPDTVLSGWPHSAAGIVARLPNLPQRGSFGGSPGSASSAVEGWYRAPAGALQR
jgi:hypothetical protein